jgi:hypothetical protein
MTEKINPPASDSEKVVDFSKLSADEKIAAFKEALSTEDFKEVDLYAKLGLDKPVVEKPSVNQEVIDELTPQYEEIRAKLAEAGYKFEEARMSETEKKIYDKVEKQAQANFAEHESELTKIDAEFPVESIAKLSIPTEDKNTVMVVLKDVAARFADGSANLKKELDSANAQLKEAKLAAPETDAETKDGESKVNAAMSEFNFKESSTDSKTE